MNARKPVIALMLLACGGLTLAAAPDVNTVSQSIRVEAGGQRGNVATVNGSIEIGDHAQVGKVSTVNGAIDIGKSVQAAGVTAVNGSITLDDGAAAASLQTVNGAIHLARNDHISGSITTVNGELVIGSSSDVVGRVSSVNGAVRLKAAHVGGGISAINGDVDIGANSHVEGGLLVGRKNDDGWFDRWLHDWFPSITRPSRIVIGPGAVVVGTLKIMRPVKLYVSDRATIGPVEGATAIIYKGDSPP